MMMTVSIRMAKVRKTMLHKMLSLVGVEAEVGAKVGVVGRVQEDHEVEAVVARQLQLRAKVNPRKNQQL